MRTSRSIPPQTFPPAVALAATIAGVALMFAGAVLAPRLGLGLRPQIAVGSLLLALPAITIVVGLREQSWRRTLALEAPSSRTVILSVLLGGALWLLSIGLVELQATLWPPSPEYLERFRAIHQALRPSGALDALVSVAVIALGPGILEEVVVRGLLLPSLRTPSSRAATVLVSALLLALVLGDAFRSALAVAVGLVLAMALSRLGWTGAIAASALFFAAMHGDLFRFLFTFTIGLVFGALRLRAGSLWPPIIAHATLNTLTFLVAPLVDDPSKATYEAQPVLGLAFFFAGAAGALPLLKNLRRSVDGSKGPA